MTSRGQTPKLNPWVIACVVTIPTFMELLDTSIANVALPQIGASLSVSQDQTTWVLTTYLVANAIILPISGWLSAKFGLKRYYMVSVGLFTLSSLLCGLSPALEWLVLFRVVQGLAGGGLASCAQTVLSDTFEPAQLSMAFAVYGMAVIVAPALGPTLGGFIADSYSWRWIFFINVPVGLCSLILTQHWVSDPPDAKERQQRTFVIDYVGLILIIVGLGGTEFVLCRGQEEDWLNSKLITACIAVSASALIAFVWWELRHKHPIVQLRILAERNFAIATCMIAVQSAALYATTAFIPQYMQGVLDYTAQQAGGVLWPGALTIVLMMPFIGTVLKRVDARVVVLCGFAILSGSLFYFSRCLYPGIDTHTAVKARVFQGVGLALLIVPLSTLAYAHLPRSDGPTASALTSLARAVGGDLGISVTSATITRGIQVHSTSLSEQLSGDNPNLHFAMQSLRGTIVSLGGSVADSTQYAYQLVFRGLSTEAATLAYIDALQGLCAVCLLMLPLVLWLKSQLPAAS